MSIKIEQVDVIMNKEAKRNLKVFLKAGLPYTIIGMLIVFAGLYLLKQIFNDNEHLVVILFLWLALFWFIYQPLFRKKIRKVASSMDNK
jgi:uncharacterized membrane protein YfcA